jgi:AraC-like DNA-binding protein
MERFAIDALIGDDRAHGLVGPAPTFLVQVPELATVDAHWHDYYELGYVLHGDAEHIVNGVPGTLHPGSAFLLSPVDFHEIEVPAGTSLRCVNVVMAPTLVEGTLESVLPGWDERLPWVFPHLESVADDVRRVCDETRARRPWWSVVTEAGLRTVLVEMARRLRPPAETVEALEAPTLRDVPPNLRQAVRYVERHFREPLTLARVAQVAHLSPHWFSEQFRVATGSPFQAYLKNRRLQFARALLDATALSVTDVCHAAGFNDLSYFGRAYRSRYGVAPSVARRS